MPDHLDILLFGPAGAGKTSLIKTFYRALHDRSTLPEHVRNILTIKDRNSNEGTTKFTKVELKSDDTAEQEVSTLADQEESKTSSRKMSSKITIHDTRG